MKKQAYGLTKEFVVNEEIKSYDFSNINDFIDYPNSAAWKKRDEFEKRP
jgi:hypothetical protein